MKLEDRIRATLRAEAERFEPELAVRAVPTRRQSWVPLVASLAGAIGIVAGMVWFYGPAPDPTGTTEPGSSSTIAQPTTSLAPHVAPELTPFVPEVTVGDGSSRLTAAFLDGTTVELEWPEDLDLTSGGVYPYGYAVIPDLAARDFFIRHGSVEDVVAQFGRPQPLAEYPDGRGGTVTWWEPEGAGVNFLGFQFGDWAVLVYEGGAEVDTPPMSAQVRETWIRSFRGETTSDGFLRLYADDPLQLGADRKMLTLQGSEGTVELLIRECEPGVIGDEIGSGEYVNWCDAGGHIEVMASGPPEFQQQVFDGLQVGELNVAGVSGPDANGSYGRLERELEGAKERWTDTLDTSAEQAYRLMLSGHLGFRIVAVAAEVRGEVATFVDNVSWIEPEPPTVDALFGIIEEAIDRDDEISVLFHRDGYPSRITLGSDPQTDAQSVLNIQLEWLD